MSKRLLYSLLGIGFLILGALIYVFLGKGTYIGNLFQALSQNRNYANEILLFVRIYLADYLWSLSLTLLLIAVNKDTHKSVILCAVVSFLLGCAWELCQHIKIANGTGDIVDIIMYFAGSCSIVTAFYIKGVIKK